MPLWLTHTSSGPLSQALLHHRSMTRTAPTPSPQLCYKANLVCSAVLYDHWVYDFDTEVLNPFFPEDYLKQKDGSKKEETEAYVPCWLHAKSWDIPLQRPARVCVIVSKFSANCCATTPSHKALKQQDQLGGQVCGHGYVSSLEMMGRIQNRAGVLLCKSLPQGHCNPPRLQWKMWPTVCVLSPSP